VTLRVKLTAVLVLVGSLALSSAVRVSAESVLLTPQFPVKGMVTMVDLGANDCIPCKMMAPILKELKQEYDGKP
jgi:thioredoxin 1